MRTGGSGSESRRGREKRDSYGNVEELLLKMKRKRDLDEGGGKEKKEQEDVKIAD